MGNTTTPIVSSKDQDLLQQYRQLRKQHEGLVLLHRQTQTTYLLKQHAYYLEKHMDQAKHKFQKEIEHGQQDNILSLIKFKLVTLSGLCSTSHKIYAIYEYPEVTLHEEIQARQRQHKTFDENQLWSILQSCNLALPHLKSTISLNSSHVFITTEGDIKIIHNDMIDQNYRFTIDPNYYYAPQKLSNFNRNDNEDALLKQVVFSLGMTILQTATLRCIDHCYDYKQQLFLEHKLQQLLENVAQTYSQDLIDLLRHMLQINPQHRCCLADIQHKLDTSFKSHSNQKSRSSDLQSIQNAKTGHENSVSSVSETESLNKQANTKRSNKQVAKHEANIITLRPSHRTSRQRNTGITALVQKQSVNKAESHTQNQVFNNTFYTDPNLLAMIRKDLQDISKLKQSTQQEIKKYTFLYPATTSLYSSKQQVTDTFSKDNVLTNKNTNFQQKSFKETPNDDKSTRLSKQIVIQQQIEIQMKQLKQSVENLTYTRFKDQQGRRYEGYVLNGKKQGKGKLIFPDGAFYKGQFKDDYMNGKGTLYYNTKHPAYEGMWQKDQFHGYGILYNQNPVILEEPFNFRDLDEVDQYWSKYQGEFHQDQKHGLGRLYLTNGEQIEAAFQNDKMHGQGRFINTKGEQIHGIWEMNKLLMVCQK